MTTKEDLILTIQRCSKYDMFEAYANYLADTGEPLDLKHAVEYLVEKFMKQNKIEIIESLTDYLIACERSLRKQ